MDADDRPFNERPLDRELTKFMASITTEYHLEEAVKCSDAQLAFAETFHRAWVLKTEPDVSSSFDQLHLAYERLKTAYAELDCDIDVILPLVVKESLQLPRGNR